MRKIFHFDSPPDPYVADAAVLCCFDARIAQAVRKFLRKQEIQRPDMIHSDCATYGGLAHFKGDQSAEAEHHRTELHRAAQLLTAQFPNISVEPYFVKFDGIWEVLPTVTNRQPTSIDRGRAV